MTIHKFFFSFVQLFVNLKLPDPSAFIISIEVRSFPGKRSIPRMLLFLVASRLLSSPRWTTTVCLSLRIGPDCLSPMSRWEPKNHYFLYKFLLDVSVGLALVRFASQSHSREWDRFLASRLTLSHQGTFGSFFFVIQIWTGHSWNSGSGSVSAHDFEQLERHRTTTHSPAVSGSIFGISIGT